MRISPYLALCGFLFTGCRNSNVDSTDASPPIIKNLRYYTHFPFNFVYTSTIAIGGQTIETVMDTGSSNLLVIGDASHCVGCVNEYGYTSTYTPGAGSTALSSSWTMNFAPIGSAKVTGYQDAVKVDGISLPAFSFGMVVQEKEIPNIWGLAYSQLANPSIAPQMPLFDSLVQARNLEDQFSLKLCGRKSGSRIVLGGFDTDAKLDQVKWTPIQGKRWYTVSVSRMSLMPTTSASTWTWDPIAFDTLIVDSGTNPLVLPSDQVAILVSVLQEVAENAGISIPTTFWPTTGQGGTATLSDAEIAKFPPIVLTLDNQQDLTTSISLSISPSIYFQTQEDGQRFLGIEPGRGSFSILGTVFMENYVVLHDRGSVNRLGFFPVAGLCM